MYVCDFAHHSLAHSLALHIWLIFFQTAYIFAWLMLLRIEEVVTLEFASIEIIPGERGC
jgi:hypothetical protein